jgi:hypothetical protein
MRENTLRIHPNTSRIQPYLFRAEYMLKYNQIHNCSQERMYCILMYSTCISHVFWCISLYSSVFLDAMKCMQNTREYVFGFFGEYGQNTLRIHPEYTRIHHNKNTTKYIRVRITPYSGAKVLDPLPGGKGCFLHPKYPREI